MISALLGEEIAQEIEDSGKMLLYTINNVKQEKIIFVISPHQHG